jgi:hypothetical protein
MNGEYRTRTDDILLAKQVLLPTELIPREPRRVVYLCVIFTNHHLFCFQNDKHQMHLQDNEHSISDSSFQELAQN